MREFRRRNYNATGMYVKRKKKFGTMVGMSDHTHDEGITGLIRDALAKQGRGAQSRLAKAVGVAQPTVNKWVKGHNRPHADLWPEIEDHLGLAPHSFARASGYSVPWPDDVYDFDGVTIRTAVDFSSLPPEDQQIVIDLVNRLLPPQDDSGR